MDIRTGNLNRTKKFYWSGAELKPLYSAELQINAIFLLLYIYIQAVQEMSLKKRQTF